MEHSSSWIVKFLIENLNIVGAVGEELLAFALVAWPA